MASFLHLELSHVLVQWRLMDFVREYLMWAMTLPDSPLGLVQTSKPIHRKYYCINGNPCFEEEQIISVTPAWHRGSELWM